jgi:hypothetical protein
MTRPDSSRISHRDLVAKNVALIVNRRRRAISRTIGGELIGRTLLICFLPCLEVNDFVVQAKRSRLSGESRRSAMRFVKFPR